MLGIHVQLFRQRLSQNVQAYATMLIKSDSLSLLDFGSRRVSKNEREA